MLDVLKDLKEVSMKSRGILVGLYFLIFFVFALFLVLAHGWRPNLIWPGLLRYLALWGGLAFSVTSLLWYAVHLIHEDLHEELNKQKSEFALEKAAFALKNNDSITKDQAQIKGRLEIIRQVRAQAEDLDLFVQSDTAGEHFILRKKEVPPDPS